MGRLTGPIHYAFILCALRKECLQFHQSSVLKIIIYPSLNDYLPRVCCLFLAIPAIRSEAALKLGPYETRMLHSYRTVAETDKTHFLLSPFSNHAHVHVYSDCMILCFVFSTWTLITYQTPTFPVRVKLLEVIMLMSRQVARCSMSAQLVRKVRNVQLQIIWSRVL